LSGRRTRGSRGLTCKGSTTKSSQRTRRKLLKSQFARLSTCACVCTAGLCVRARATLNTRVCMGMGACASVPAYGYVSVGTCVCARVCQTSVCTWMRVCVLMWYPRLIGHREITRYQDFDVTPRTIGSQNRRSLVITIRFNISDGSSQDKKFGSLF